MGAVPSVQGWRPVPVQAAVQPGCKVDEGAPGRRRVAVTGQDLADIEDEREGEPVVTFGEPRVVTGGVVVHPATIHRRGAGTGRHAQLVDGWWPRCRSGFGAAPAAFTGDGLRGRADRFGLAGEGRERGWGGVELAVEPAHLAAGPGELFAEAGVVVFEPADPGLQSLYFFGQVVSLAATGGAAPDLVGLLAVGLAAVFRCGSWLARDGELSSAVGAAAGPTGAHVPSVGPGRTQVVRVPHLSVTGRVEIPGNRGGMHYEE